MEKSNSSTSQKHSSGDEGDTERDDEEPTTSRGYNLSPEQNSQNMNDLKALDYNSADDVRQAMKTVLAGKLPPQSFSEEANNFQIKVQNEPGLVKMNELVNQKPAQDVNKAGQRPVQQNLYEKMNSKAQARTSKANCSESSRLKRPGRTPKAGPSKTVRKYNITSMYLGKLSNVVPFKRPWESDSASDVESIFSH